MSFALRGVLELHSLVSGPQRCSRKLRATGADEISSQDDVGTMDEDGTFKGARLRTCENAIANIDEYPLCIGAKIKHGEFGGPNSWGLIFGGYAYLRCSGHDTHYANTNPST
ncbi:hypothetical protein DL96DRAFT_1721338 [Flagelloscypha sp. PMI_526]|nr:hypothetical protein DL96DRAFT_1721338 [Flagelloscypha sp. PMI_526]